MSTLHYIILSSIQRPLWFSTFKVQKVPTYKFLKKVEYVIVFIIAPLQFLNHIKLFWLNKALACDTYEMDEFRLIVLIPVIL